MKSCVPKCVLFDLDGTLLDSLPGIVFSIQQACRDVGIQLPPVQALRAFLGPPIRAIFAGALGTNDDALLDRLESRFRASYDREGWEKTVVFPGANALLRALKARGHALFVVSNKPRHIALRSLEHCCLLEFFEAVYTRDSRDPAYSGKAEMLGQFLLEYGVNPSQCMVVGDTLEDVQAADAHAMDVAFMEHGYGVVSDDHVVKYRMESFSDFFDYLNAEVEK